MTRHADNGIQRLGLCQVLQLARPRGVRDRRPQRGLHDGPQQHVGRQPLRLDGGEPLEVASREPLAAAPRHEAITVGPQAVPPGGALDQNGTEPVGQRHPERFEQMRHGDAFRGRIVRAEHHEPAIREERVQGRGEGIG